MAQLETKMEEAGVSRSELALRLNKSSGRVSQVFNDPGNLSLRVIVEYAHALGMKAGLIAYDDGDPENANGPISPDVFVQCWRRANCPSDLFEAEDTNAWTTFATEPDSTNPYVNLPAPNYTRGWLAEQSQVPRMWGTLESQKLTMPEERAA